MGIYFCIPATILDLCRGMWLHYLESYSQPVVGWQAVWGQALPNPQATPSEDSACYPVNSPAVGTNHAQHRGDSGFLSALRVSFPGSGLFLTGMHS